MKKILFYLILVGNLCAFLPVEGASNRVERLEAYVLNEDIPEAVKTRIAGSFTTVGEHMLVGKRIDEIAANKASHESLVRSVFERVLSGFFVEKIEIIPGSTTRMDIMLTPWGNTVRSAEIEWRDDAVPEVARLWVRKDISGINEKIEPMLVGVPLEAVEWSSGIIKERIHSELMGNLPEYQAVIEIQGGEQSKIVISLIPKGALLGALEIDVVSEGFPALLIQSTKQELNEKLQPLQSVPTDFLYRHQKDVEGLVDEILAGSKAVQRFDLKKEISWQAKPIPRLTVSMMPEHWRLRLEGWSDFNRRDDRGGKPENARLIGYGYLGYQLNSKQEIFSEVLLPPTNWEEWDVRLGYAQRLNQDNWLGVRGHFNYSKPMFFLEHRMSSRWIFRAESTLDAERYEAALRYRFHEFFSVEVVGDKNSLYLRLRGNL